MERFSQKPKDWLIVHVDGAADNRSRGAAGAVVADSRGQVLDLAGRRVRAIEENSGSLSNVEAEYAALILGMELAQKFRDRPIEFRCDCEVVVRQMRGEFGVKSAAIKNWHRRACELARSFRQVRYVHIRRQQNQLANGLAADALRGQERMSIRR